MKKESPGGERLALRAALYPGNEIDQKRKIKNTIKCAYEHASNAVHGREIAKKNGQAMQKAWSDIQGAGEIVRLMIKELIKNPDIDWDEIEISGTRICLDK